MYFIRRVIYYLTSFITLVQGVRNWPRLLRLRGQGGAETLLELRDGTQFAVRSLMDAWIVKETNLDRDYEVHGATIQDGWSVVDIGAGLGDFTVFAAQRTPHGRVFAYEPAPDSAALLEQNIRLNRIGNVETYPYAVSDKAGTLTLDVSGGVAVQYRTVGETSHAGGKITVRSVALADVLAGLPDGVCDFLKMDCEGAEYDMLLHLDGVLLKRIRRICLEYHEGVTEYSHADLERCFLAQGWRVTVHPSRVRRELGFLYAENSAKLPDR
jgi:FkbM family methyltransferase